MTMTNRTMRRYALIARTVVESNGGDDMTPETFAKLLAETCGSADEIRDLGRCFSAMGERLGERAMERRDDESHN